MSDDPPPPEPLSWQMHGYDHTLTYHNDHSYTLVVTPSKESKPWRHTLGRTCRMGD